MPREKIARGTKGESSSPEVRENSLNTYLTEKVLTDHTKHVQGENTVALKSPRDLHAHRPIVMHAPQNQRVKTEGPINLDVVFRYNMQHNCLLAQNPVVRPYLRACNQPRYKGTQYPGPQSRTLHFVQILKSLIAFLLTHHC